MSEKAIASTILGEIEDRGLDAEYLQGQGYDGSGSMACVRKGASSIILQKYPLATYVHCCSHVLHLSIANACSLPLVRNIYMYTYILISVVVQQSAYLFHLRVS